MADQVATQNNTDAGTTTDVNASETLLVAEPQANQDNAQKSTDATKAADGIEAKPTTATTADADAEKQKAAGEKAKEGKAEGAPEKYEFKAAEGVTLDADLVTELSTVAKELNLPQEQAQKFADLGGKLVEKTAKGIQEAQTKSWAEARTKWVTEIKTDKELGGSNFSQSREMALRAVRFAGVPELKQVFDSGWGDHPALFKAFVKFGKALGEDRMIDADVNAGSKSAAQVLYPSQNQ